MKVRRLNSPAGLSGFTLLELVVVAGLVAAGSLLIAGSLGRRREAALPAAQAIVTSLVASGRARAVASGRPTRILVHHDARSPRATERFLRCLALEERLGAEWTTVLTVHLPSGVHVVPHLSRQSAGLMEAPQSWIQPDGTRLHSSCLFRPLVARAVDAPETEAWAEIVFSAHGTTVTSGQVVLGAARWRVPGESAAGSLAFVGPEQVRGLQISGYGIVLPINGREGL